MKHRDWIGKAAPALTPEQRAAVVREAFEAIVAVGFMKWKAEELMGYGYEAGEQDREHYARLYEKDHFRAFAARAAGATDARLLETRAYWIGKAKTMDLGAWLEVQSKGRGGDPFYETVAREVEARQLIRAGGREH